MADIAATVNEARKAARKSGKFEWRHNGLRHSYCSYRLAVTADVARVSYEAGNSPAIIHAHYKSLVTEKAGKKWFAIMPDRQQNIVPLAVNG